MKTADNIFVEYVDSVNFTIDGRFTSFFQCFNFISPILIGSYYVLDMYKNSICYVKPNSFFLCDYSVEEVLEMRYDFYSKVIHPEDISLWTDMLNIVFKCCTDSIDKRDEIDHFFCTYRLKRDYSFLTLHPLPQMVYQRMKPIWINDKQLYLICSIASSAIRDTGNLRLYNKDKSIYDEYNFTTNRWRKIHKKSLTEREIAILILAQQGKSSREIADKLFKSQNTIRNQIRDLFCKLEVHSIQEAIEVAHHHGIL